MAGIQKNASVMDSSAWIEYLRGTERGKKIKEAMTGELYTPALVVTEVIAHMDKTNEGDDAYRAIATLSIIMVANAQLALDAARFYRVLRKKNSKFSYGDAHVVATAHALEGTIITCDTDFRNVPGAKVIA